MLYKMITNARNKWFESKECTVKEIIQYMVDKDEMRDSQIDAIKTYLYLKIKCNNRPLSELMIDGVFNNQIDISEFELKDKTRDVLLSNPSAMALFQYSLLKNDKGEELFSGINKEIRKNADSLNYVQVIKDMFANTSFTDYLFSLPMGAGKTYLMAAFIYLDLYFALNEPNNKAFAHNFIVCAPSGLKSSVIPSLKTIQNFDATWILPEESVKQIKSILKFEILDAVKSGKKSNKTKNPNVQKISNYQPYNSLIGLVMVTNAEKVILDDVKIEDKKTRQISFDELEQNQKGMNELKKLISYIPNLQVLVDEVHHLADEDIKLNGVINYWNLTKNMNSMIGFSGTPFYNSKQPVKISENLTYQTSQIPFIVNYFPLVKAVESFLKKPKIKWSEVRDSSIIIEKGLTEFFDTYKDTIYQNGTCAKVAIYVGRIEKLREEVYPQCIQIALKYGLNPDEAILCYHGADSKKKYSCSKEEELEFARLDDKSSKKRIVLLAQIGKEGWDCKSLTSVILSQQGDSPRNMILQTTCRCLRQVDRNNPSETALIWLNDYNANILNAQLQLEQETSIEEINQIERKFIHSIKRYDRTKKLKLPPIDFYQLKVSYEKAIKEDNLNIDQRLKQIIPIKESRAVRESNIKGEEKGIVEFQDDYGYNFTTYLTWLSDISKESFNLITVQDLLKYNHILFGLFSSITIKTNGLSKLNNLYNNYQVKSEIRKAYQEKYTYTTKEELLGETKSLFNKDNFSDVIKASDLNKFYPSNSSVEDIMLADRRGSLYTIEQENKIKILIDNGMEEIAKQQFDLPLELKNKDKTFHYLPYNFSQSNFEQNLFKDVLKLPLFKNNNLEIYYNGDRALTEFKIKCYKKTAHNWNYVGMYTPDFIIINRQDNKIAKALIIETKGTGFADDKNFNDKKEFVKNKFLEINKNKFDYFYVEDNENNTQAMERLTHKISKFFKEEQ